MREIASFWELKGEYRNILTLQTRIMSIDKQESIRTF